MGDSQGNGDIEEAIKRVQKQIRVVKAHIEKKCKRKVMAGNAIWPWIIETSGTIMRRFGVMADGMTPFQKHRGEASVKPWAHVGERVLYRPAKTVVLAKEDNRWIDGISVGMIDRTGEYLIATSEGIIKTAYEPSRHPVNEQWSMDEIERIRGTPWRPVPTRDSTHIPTTIGIGDEGDEQEDSAAPVRMSPEVMAEDADRKVTVEAPAEKGKIQRQFYVREGHIRQFGYHVGWPACEEMRQGRTRGWKTHSAECRQRIMESIMGSGNRQSKMKVTAARIREEEHVVKRNLDEEADVRPGAFP